jgi:WD40 repeat protein
MSPLLDRRIALALGVLFGSAVGTPAAPPSLGGQPARGLGVGAVAFSPDGSALASGSDDKTLILWDVANKRAKVRLQGHTDSVSSLAFSPDGFGGDFSPGVVPDITYLLTVG